MNITASKLYDFMQCPHRVWRDIYGPQKEKIREINPFVQLLWNRGVLYEEKVISQFGKYLDLSKGSLEDRFAKTIEAMEAKTPFIYQGVLMVDNIVGIPDLLKLNSDNTYVPIDIKSGMGTEGAKESAGKEGKPKEHYAVQLALYCDALNRLGFANKRQGIIFDINGDQVLYNLDNSIGKIKKITFWELYKNIFNNVSLLIENKIKNKPAIGGVCKLCPWYNSCKKWATEEDDPTCLFYLGRRNRDILNKDIQANTIQDILNLDVDELIRRKKADKTFLKGLGKPMVEKIITRANIFKNTQKPVVYGEIFFPQVSYELFFDIEDDPTRGFVYLHGVYERSPDGEKYIDFTAKEVSPEEEKEAWVNFWKYIKSLPQGDYAVYYYSPHEKSTYRRMQRIYPDVISEIELENFFNNPNVIDLYHIVLKQTDWPVGSYSLKGLAQYLGFSWQEETPSGALSIQWFNEYIKTKNAKILERILLYNKDDCRATMVLKDGISKLCKTIK